MNNSLPATKTPPAEFNRQRWRALHVIRFLLLGGLTVGLVALTFFAAVSVLLYLTAYASYLLNSPLIVVVPVIYCVALGFGGFVLLKACNRKLSLAWGLSCRKCGCDFNAAYYEQPAGDGLCYPCQHAVTGEFSGGIPLYEIARSQPADLQNPYASPVAVVAAPSVAPRKRFGFGSSDALTVKFIFMLLIPMAGIMVAMVPVLLTIALLQWAVVPLGFVREPAWLLAEMERRYRRDLIGIVRLAVGGVLLTALFTLICYNVLAWRDDPLLVAYLVSASCGFGITWGIGQWLKRTRVRNSLAVYFTPLFNKKMLPVTLHWPTGTILKSSPRIRFRCVDNAPLKLAVYDELTEGILLERTFPATASDDWSELEIPIDAPELGTAPLDRLWFEFRAANDRRWMVWRADVRECLVTADEQEEWLLI